MRYLRFYAVLLALLSAAIGSLVSPALAGNQSAVPTRPSKLQDAEVSGFFLKNLREIDAQREIQRLKDEKEMEEGRKKTVTKNLDSSLISEEDNVFLPGTTVQDIRLEADYIIQSQYFNPGHPAHGAVNNVYGSPTWIVPRENAMAILALLQAYQKTGKRIYKDRAELAADYLVRMQDSDGAWFDQYSYENPVTFSKSPTQTAEVMMALDKLGYCRDRYHAMKKGAQYLMSLQDPANKGGLDDGLLGGGKKADGTYHTWRWASDNSYGYLALKDAAKWARKAGDRPFAIKAGHSAMRVLNGINESLYVDDPNDADYGVWRRAINENGVPQETNYHEWINYAPQMLDLPARGVGNALVGEWIHRTLQKADGAVVWDDGFFSNRKSPGLSFQAILVWQDLGQTQYAQAAWDWAVNSGLWQRTPDANGVAGSWIDWTEGTTTAQQWERFIDTSFYAVSVMNGGYNFLK